MSIFKNLMTKLNAIREELATQVLLEGAALADGTIVEAVSFEVGQVVLVPVEDGEAIPLPAGVYDLDNKLTVTTDDNGVILAVAPTETQDAETPGTTEVESATEPAQEMAAKRVIETQTMTKEKVFSAVDISEMVDKAIETKMAAYADDKQAMTAQIEALKLELSEATAARPISRAPRKAMNEDKYFAEPKTPQERLLNLSQTLKTQEEQ